MIDLKKQMISKYQVYYLKHTHRQNLMLLGTSKNKLKKTMDLTRADFVNMYLILFLKKNYS